MSVSLARTDDSLEFARNLAPAASQFAYAHGIVRYSKDLASVTPLPMSLTPWAADAAMVAETRELTTLYNELYARVSYEREFLAESLATARAVDPFVARLFDCLPPQLPERPWLFLNRNDCMPHFAAGEVVPKQVEINLFAASLGQVSAKVNRMHRYLYAETAVADGLWANTAGDDLVRSFVDAWKVVGGPEAVLLILVDPSEVNVFDIRATEVRLVVDHGIKVRRASLAELGAQGELRGGHLYLRGERVAIGYFRTGYAPTHYTEDGWRCRELLEASSAVSVPSVSAQLANMKKLQEVLADPKVLRRFVSDADARRLERSFARFARPEQEIEWKGERGKARELAIAHPQDWVLKPHREGGSNNFFDDEMVAKLKMLSREDSEGFILMEMIQQQPFHSVRLVQGRVEEGPCATELGVFGAYLAPGTGQPPLFNRETGYLVRTKDVANKEGLVLGGYSFMDSVLV